MRNIEEHYLYIFFEGNLMAILESHIHSSILGTVDSTRPGTE
jgi:hypothetical protein